MTAYQFGDWLIEPDLNRASSGDREVELEPVTMNVLTFMLERPGETLSIDQFLSNVWRGRVVEPNAVHRNLTMIRRALGDSTRNPRYVANVRKRGYRTLAPVTPVGKRPAAAGAGRGQSGLAGAPDVIPQASKTAGAARTGHRMAMVSLLVVAAVAAAALLTLLPSSETSGGNRIAVLSFANMSGDQDLEYLADGLSDELIHHLSRHGQLQVISRRSSFYFKGSKATTPEIARKLDVAYVVDGSIRTLTDDQLEVKSQVIDTRSDVSLWTGSFRHDRADFFSLQKEIASAMIDALRAPMGLELVQVSEASGVHPDAYEAYLRGRHLMRRRTDTSSLRAIEEFKTAVSLDPEYALAHAWLADALLFAEPKDMAWSDLLSLAQKHVDAVMLLDPALPEAYFAKGRLLTNMHRYEEAQQYFLKAIEMNPSFAEAYSHLTWRPMPLSKDFLVWSRKAVLLDPVSREAHWDYIFTLSRAGRFEEAAQQIEEYASLDPLGAIVQRAQLSAIGGTWADPILAYLEVAKSGRDDLSPAANVLLDGRLASVGLEEEALRAPDGEPYLTMSWFGDPQEAVRMAMAAQAQDPLRLSPRVMGFVLVNAGRYREARPYLEAIYRRWGNRLTRDDWWSSYLGEALVAVRRFEGDDAGADEAIAMMRDNAHRILQYGPGTTGWIFSADYQAGVAEYLAGNRDAGLELIAKAADEGFWISPPSPFQEPMYREPGFIEILDRQAERQNRERRRVLEVACKPGFSSAVWQPSGGTCSRYAT